MITALELPLGDDPSAQPHSLSPGGTPLRYPMQEEFAQWQAAGLTAAAAGRKVRATTSAVWKWSRNKRVLARVQFLRGNTDAVLRRKHAHAEALLHQIMDGSADDYVRYVPATTDDDGNECPARHEPDWERIAAMPDGERRALMSIVKWMSNDRIELHSKLDALAQYRALNGLDAPKKVEVGGIKGGAPVAYEYDFSRVPPDEVTSLAATMRAARVPKPSAE